MTYDRRKYDGFTLEEKLDAALQLLDEISQAFPYGVATHRQTHVAWAQAKQAEAEFWRELKLDIVKKGTFGILVILIGLIASGISIKLGIWRS